MTGSGKEDEQRRKQPKVRHEKLNVIGAGSFGVVYRGIAHIEGVQPKFVAIKLLKKTNIEDILDERRANQVVANACRKEYCPHIIRFLGEYKDLETSAHAFVFEYAAGGDAYSRLEKMGRYSEANARDVIKGALGGLKFLHKNCVIHRDIKPANVLLKGKTFPTTAALTDFGLSSIFNPESDDWVQFNSIGTMTYSPPEAFKFNVVTTKSDIWPVGVMMYEILMNAHPFDQEELPLDIVVQRILHLDLKISEQNEEFKHLSPNAISLMKLLLHRTQRERPDAEQALNHPWFATAPEELKLSGLNLNSRPKNNANLAEIMELARFAKTSRRVAIKRRQIGKHEERGNITRSGGEDASTGSARSETPGQRKISRGAQMKQQSESKKTTNSQSGGVRLPANIIGKPKQNSSASGSQADLLQQKTPEKTKYVTGSGKGSSIELVDDVSYTKKRLPLPSEKRGIRREELERRRDHLRRKHAANDTASAASER